MLTSTLVSGPALSRRFGRAIHIDLVGGPATTCSFHCVYCRSSKPSLRPDGAWPAPPALADELKRALDGTPDVETLVLAGNGEPTRHPAFATIVDETIALRDAMTPAARVAIVSNGSTLDQVTVRTALSRADVRLMKLDAGDATTFRRLSGAGLPLGRLIGQLRHVGGVTLQSRFVRNASRSIDNTSAAAVDAWLQAVARIAPASVQVCGREWEAHQALDDVPRAELAHIAARVEGIGIPARVV